MFVFLVSASTSWFRRWGGFGPGTKAALSWVYSRSPACFLFLSGLCRSGVAPALPDPQEVKSLKMGSGRGHVQGIGTYWIWVTKPSLDISPSCHQGPWDPKRTPHPCQVQSSYEPQGGRSLAWKCGCHQILCLGLCPTRHLLITIFRVSC